MTHSLPPEPPQRPTSSVNLPQSPEALVDQLAHRVEILEQAKQRWKRIAVSALVALILLVLSVAGTWGYLMFDAHQQVTQERQRAMEAMREAQQKIKKPERLLEQIEQPKRDGR
jgi:hypothetical protein